MPSRAVTDLACLLDSSSANKQVFTIWNDSLNHFTLLSHSSSWLPSRLWPLLASPHLGVLPLLPGQRGQSGRLMCFEGLIIPHGSSLYLTLPPSVQLSSRSPGDLVRATPAAADLNPA